MNSDQQCPMMLPQCLETLTERAEEDRALVFAARSDTAAAGRLFDRYYPEVFRYVYHSTLDHAVTEDLTSNVFFSAFRHLGLFRWRGIPFRAWLYRIEEECGGQRLRRCTCRYVLSDGRTVSLPETDPEHPGPLPLTTEQQM